MPARALLHQMITIEEVVNLVTVKLKRLRVINLWAGAKMCASLD